MENRPVPLLGAGISGLTAAWRLAERGARVRVIEAGAQPGGLIQTRRVPEGLIETAARSFVWTGDVARLFAAVGIEPLFARPESHRRYIYRNGRPRRWPLGAGETLGLAGHVAGAWITRRLKPRGDESISTWADRALGRDARRWLIGPALQGIYASPPDALAARAIFGGARVRGKIAAPPEGMGQLTARLHEALIARGTTFDFNTRVDSLADLGAGPESPVVICTGAREAARLLAPHAPRLAEAIARIRMTSLLSVTAFYPPHRADTRGLGVLFPRHHGIAALGVLFNADMFTGRSALRSETWIYGDPSRDEIVEVQRNLDSTLRADRHFVTGRDQEPVAIYPTPSIAELPIYDKAVLEVKAALNELPPWITLRGNYLGKLGVSNLVAARVF